MIFSKVFFKLLFFFDIFENNSTKLLYKELFFPIFLVQIFNFGNFFKLLDFKTFISNLLCSNYR